MENGDIARAKIFAKTETGGQVELLLLRRRAEFVEAPAHILAGPPSVPA